MIANVLLQFAPSGSTIGAVVAITFLIMFLGIAFVAFKALKRTVRMAFRLTAVGVILMVGVIGSTILWYYSSSGPPKLKPPTERRR